MKQEPHHIILRHSGDASPVMLRSGYTTGTCAAAAAKGSALMLKHQVSVREVTLTLPAGVTATFKLHGQTFDVKSASCFVIKGAGDDPDITNGVEIHATITRCNTPATAENRLVISGGEGIGQVTKPGLAVAPGEWAINPIPRRMIDEAVSSVVFPACNPSVNSYEVSISIPDGAERAKKTLNARLGIVGGLSILGTTGIVRPVSAKAWTDTIDASLDVAKACKTQTVVLSTGRSSEMAAQKHFNNSIPATLSSLSFDLNQPAVKSVLSDILLPEEAFIMMGDHIAYTLKACLERGFLSPVIAVQFAKLIKIACGHENTHAAASDLDIAQLVTWGQEHSLSQTLLETIIKANTAREIAIACSFDQSLLNLLFQQACAAIKVHAPGISPHILVADYNGNCVFYRS